MDQGDDDEGLMKYGSGKRCGCVVFWLFCAVLYTSQFVFGTWSAVLLFLAEDYVMFGVLASPLVIPTLVLSIVSMVWYRDQDKVNAFLKETHSDDSHLRNFKPLIGFGTVLSHITGLGVLYRYFQLIVYTAKNTKSCDIFSLQRDLLLIQFLFGFLTTAPLIIIHTYQLLPDLVEANLDLSWPFFPVIFASWVVSVLSLLLTLISYIANDRLHSENRRVVYPGYIATLIWHACMVAGRIAALALFAIAFGPYVTIVIGVHWIAAFAWTVFEKTNFCGDVTTTPPKKRLYFEVPFMFVISFVYLFLFFNIRDGSTMSRIVVYHVLTSVETLVLAALFYALRPTLPFSAWLFAFTVGIYIMGVAFMSLYYAAWHPSRTSDCFLVGIPYSCDCCHVFRKLPATDTTGNVDLPLDDDNAVQMGGHMYGMRGQIDGVVAGTGDTGITLTEYDPLANLSALTERRSSFTVGQLSRSLTTTPMSTPQHRRAPDSSVSSIQPSAYQFSGRSSSLKQERSRVRTSGMEFLSSTPIIPHEQGVRTRPNNAKQRPVSVSVETGIGMRPRLLSENVRTQVDPNSTGIGQLSAKERRPASESIDVSSSFTPMHRRHTSRFQRSGSDRFPHRSDITFEGDDKATPMTGFHSAPLARRSEDLTSNPTFQSRPPCGPTRYFMQSYSGTVVLPSPIGEEPMSPTGLTTLGYQMVPPIVLQVNGQSPKLSVNRKNSNAVQQEPIYSVPYTHPINGPNRSHSNRWNDLNYTELTPTRTGHNGHADMSSRPRQRSLSPLGGNKGRRRSSPVANSRSTNSTPKHSPYPGHRRRNSSHPLHTRDPMMEFTQLYSTSPSGYNGAGVKDKGIATSTTTTARDRISTSGEHRGHSTSSSYLMSSDNDADNVNEDDPRPPQPVSNGITVPVHNTPISIVNKKHDQLKVTAHRQNSDEFLITKLHNINGTLV